MAEGIEIKGIPPYDGRYELDTSYFLNGEYRILKKVAGLLPLDISEAFEKRDVELFVALAVIARQRAGQDTILEILWKAEAGKITLYDDSPEEGEADGPPAIPSPPSEPPSGSTENSGPGGDGTKNGGDVSQETSNLHSIGSPSLDISAISGQAI